MRIALLMTVVMLPVLVGAQAPPPAPQGERPRFEAASVKPNQSKEPGIMRRPSPGRVFYSNAPIHTIVEEAYSMRPDRILNYPDWVEKERFDVSATYSPDRQRQVRQMLQTLLEERFSLRVHREMREMAVYELVKARADGQLGPRLQPSTVDCVPKPGAKSPCTLDIRSGLFRGVGIGWGNGVPLALNIGVWDRPIIDKTGLSGAFDVDLQWTPDPAQARDTDAAARAAAAVAATPGDRVSIFTALQEQLGLRLQPARAQLEVLIIDRVERPTPD
ncbi:MAG TPA: TIGR03435 family protein [Vicinamibacterales bacterium]|nr:TIGR03435 family protein [Vicinamibacterales bacterium]